jgi:hypothetical protein
MFTEEKNDGKTLLIIKLLESSSLILLIDKETTVQFLFN